MKLNTILTLIAAMTAAELGKPVAAQSCVDMPSGVISWWPAEGDGSDPVCGNDAMPGNGASYAAGLVGQAFSLDGVNDIFFTEYNPGFTPLTGAITIEAWVRRESADTGTIISKYNTQLDQRAWILLVNADGGVRLGMYNDITDEARVADTVDAGLVSVGSFHHVAGTFDVATQDLLIYVDGVAEPNALLPGFDDEVTFAETASPVRIGAFANFEGLLDGAFHGLIDEPTVYNRALAPEEIQAIYEAGSAGKCLTDRVYNLTQDTWFLTIGAAIDAAVDGDEIVATPWTYCETIDLAGKAITLRSADPGDHEVVGLTVIDATVPGGSAVTCTSGEGPGTVLDGLTITGGDAVDGGGMVVVAASPTIRNCRFISNEADFGGGLYLEDSSSTVTDCEFGVNTASSRGGGLRITDSNGPVISGCRFVGNASVRGGGLSSVNSVITISECEFTNHAVNNNGGGVHALGSTLLVSACDFSDNRANNSGGGIAGDDSIIDLTSCRFAKNHARSVGGAILAAATVGNVIACEFEANSSSRGSALYVLADGQPTVVSDCGFYGNMLAPTPPPGAPGGGAVYVKTLNDGPAAAAVDQCLFSGNQSVALVADGGATDVDIESCTFAGHAAGGAVLACQAATVDLLNCVVWDEFAPEFTEILEGQIYWSYCNVYGTGGASGQTGTNLDASPLFVDPDGADGFPGTLDDDLRLTADSPCIGAGLGMHDPNDPQFDFDGIPRHLGTIDLGVFEFPVDCDESGVPDWEEIEAGVLDDCNDTLYYDGCESKLDCNGNGQIDECDIADGLFADGNENGFPDECEVFGEIAGFVVWPQDAGSIEGGTSQPLVSQDLIVTGTLTIEAGVEVLFAKDVSLTVLAGGELIVNGSPNAPVVFGSINQFESAGDWGGIRFAPGSSGGLSYAVVEYTRTHGVAIEGADVSVEDCVIREVAGVDQPPAAGAMPALPGGNAYGIRVIGGVSPMILRNTIERVRGGVGSCGAAGAAGAPGASGLDGIASGENGSNGLAPVDGDGESGGQGAVGGDAVGIYCGPGTSPVLRDNRVDGVTGGAGGGGGAGGRGGSGGVGGYGGNADVFAVPPLFDGGDGGDGGDGAHGGPGGGAGAGGDAVAIWLDDVATAEAHQNLMAHVRGGQGGGGGRGGRGGNGGSAGWGGFGASITVPIVSIDLPGEPGVGGDGGNSGTGGDGGPGGSGGAAQGMIVSSASATTLDLAHNTIARMDNGPAGDPGTAGEAGAFGHKGLGGTQSIGLWIDYFFLLVPDNGHCPEEGSCHIPHDTFGCNNEDCCEYICVFDSYCCEVAWDYQCVWLANMICLPASGLVYIITLADDGTDGTENTDGAPGVPGTQGNITGMLAGGEALLNVANTIVESASATQSTGLAVAGNGGLVVNYSNLFGFGNPYGPGVSDQGLGMVLADPMFVDPDDGDFHLLEASPCIDAGDNDTVPDGLETDLDGNVRIFDGNDDDVADVDMGVYEFDGVVTCAADITGDGAVDVQDLIDVILAWGCMEPPGACPADVTGDGVVNVQDLIEIVLVWGPCAP